jgi:HSP20 family molecular chaperone IbpA
MFSLIPWGELSKAMGPRTGDPFGMMRRDMEALVNRVFGENALLPEMEPERFWGVTAEENEKEIVLRFELPGFEPGEVSVNLAGTVLTVEAVRPAPEEKKEAEARRVRRVITLPGNVEPEKLEAVYRNGMLEVHVPWAPAARGRAIAVKT